jgi:hypothetical protein
MLMRFSSIKCQYKDITDNIDGVLCNLIENKKLKLAETFLTKWLLKSDYYTSGHKLGYFFDTTVSSISEHAEFAESLITKYFNHDDFKLHIAAFDLVKKNNHIKLDQKIIRSLNFEDILFICKKILGYIYNADTLCSLVFSILTAKPENEKVANLAIEVFIEHIGKDYSTTTLDFLKEKIKKPDFADPIKVILKRIISAIEKRLEALKSLPRLKELEVSPKYLSQISLEKNKILREQMEKAEKGTLFAAISKIPLKHGKGSFSYYDNGYTNITKIKLSSMSYEVALSEVINPVSSSIKRISLRDAKRGQK